MDKDPKDASFADTLYISVVIKGNASFVTDKMEAIQALNGLMEKYQPEGKYEKVSDNGNVLSYVSIIKIIPASIRGKYKIGQNVNTDERMDLAKKIFKKNPHAIETLKVMGFKIINDIPVMTSEPDW